MRTIHKFPLSVLGQQEVTMPANSEMLTVGQDGTGALSLWAIVDPEAEKEKRNILVVGTGGPLPESSEEEHYHYLGTAIMRAGLVWHVFEVEDASFDSLKENSDE